MTNWTTYNYANHSLLNMHVMDSPYPLHIQWTLPIHYTCNGLFQPNNQQPTYKKSIEAVVSVFNGDGCVGPFTPQFTVPLLSFQRCKARHFWYMRSQSSTIMLIIHKQRFWIGLVHNVAQYCYNPIIYVFNSVK